MQCSSGKDTRQGSGMRRERRPENFVKFEVGVGEMSVSELDTGINVLLKSYPGGGGGG